MNVISSNYLKDIHLCSSGFMSNADNSRTHPFNELFFNQTMNQRAFKKKGSLNRYFYRYFHIKHHHNQIRHKYDIEHFLGISQNKFLLVIMYMAAD